MWCWVADRPAVGLLPLGTGNDLARVLGWGKSIRLDDLEARLRSLDQARVALVDRWRVDGQLPEGRSSMMMSNYLSIGIDTKAALLWARMKRALPWAFRLRLLNKLWYIICGTPEVVLHSYKDLANRCTYAQRALAKFACRMPLVLMLQSGRFVARAHRCIRSIPSQIDM